MFDRFGEFDSAEEINEAAVKLREKKDAESLRILAEENGIDGEVAKAFLDGDIPMLCDAMSAAIGKLDMEAKQIDCAEIMQDWVEYIKAGCIEDEKIAAAVRQKNKKLEGAVAALLKWSLANQHPIPKKILKAAGITYKCTLGIPGMARAKRIITEYYMGVK